MGDLIRAVTGVFGYAPRGITNISWRQARWIQYRFDRAILKDDTLETLEDA
jgi:hypothetical protein